MPRKPNTEKATARRKERLLIALAKHRGIVKDAVKDAGVCRRTFYQWRQDDDEFAAAVMDVEEATLDEIESVAQKMIIEDRNPAMTIFYLKTKGRHRGFVERQEVQMSSGDLASLHELMNEKAAAHERDY